MDKAELLLAVLKEGDWEQGESLWLELLDAEISDVETFRKAARMMWNRGQRKRTTDLLELTSSVGREKNKPLLWLESLRMLVEYNPFHKGLSDALPEAFKSFYAERKHLIGWIDKIVAKKLPPTQFVNTIDRLAVFKEGMFVEHQNGWGIGKIQKILEDRMAIRVDLEMKANHEMDALAASECLKSLDPENLEVILKFDKDRLKKEAVEDPVKLICRVLKHAGEPVNTQRIKQQIYPDIVQEDQWSTWWGKTRRLLITHPFIEVSQGNHARYSMRTEAGSWEDEISKAFNIAETLDKPSLVLDYLKNSDEEKHLDIFAQGLSQISAEHCHSGEPWYALECYLVLQSCIQRGASQPADLLSVENILGPDPMTVYAHLRLTSLAQITLKTVLEHCPNWEHGIAMVLKKGTDMARETLFKHILREDKFNDRILLVFQEIMNNRLSYPEAYIWVAKNVIQGRIPDKHKMFDPVETLSEMIETGGTFRAIGQLDNAKKLSKLFSSGVADKILPLLDAERAHRMFNLLLKNTWLPSTFWNEIKEEIQEKYPKLFSQVTPLYTTKAGLEKYERELQDIMQHKIPQNARALGEAIAHGDLSENAELDAAREIQWQIMHKVQEMRNNLSRASVIDFKTLTIDKVQPGHKVTLEDGQGKEIAYTILGPWDVDTNNNIVSFMSLIGQTMIGAKVNDTVTLPSGTYKVLNIGLYQE